MRTVTPVSRLRRLLTAVLLAAAALAGAPTASAVEPGIAVGPRFDSPINVDEVAAVDAAGASWVRLFVNWNVLEAPADGAHDMHAIAALERRVAAHAAAGTKVLVVVTMAPKWANGSDDPSVPPRDPRHYAEFVAFLAGELDGRVAAWELWNEPNDGPEPGFWAGPADPGGYAALLKAAYPAIKQADPDAAVITGGLVANDFEFVEGLLAHGARDAFDAVAVHTDTACLTSPPDEVYREPDGRIGRYSFTGYREIHALTGKPVWMTEMGWSSTGATCARGGRAGTKPGGVPEPQQAANLAAAYACLQSDPFVAVALWFSLQDVSASDVDDHRLGLLRHDASAKPAYAAFQQWAHARPARRCGAEVDHTPPEVRILAPSQNQQYLDRLAIEATATDAGTGVRRMELYADGRKTPGSQFGARFVRNWLGARELSVGRHTLTVRARDNAGNVGQSSVTVIKDVAGNIRVGRPLLRFKAIRRPGRAVALSGSVAAAPGATVAPRGRVRILLEQRRGGRWVTVSRYSKGIARPFAFTAPIRRPGLWRIHARFAAEKPYAPVRSRYWVARF